ncbi:unnamed protein product [Gadus morhua 'NCC']
MERTVREGLWGCHDDLQNISSLTPPRYNLRKLMKQRRLHPPSSKPRGGALTLRRLTFPTSASALTSGACWLSRKAVALPSSQRESSLNGARLELV